MEMFLGMMNGVVKPGVSTKLYNMNIVQPSVFDKVNKRIRSDLMFFTKRGLFQKYPLRYVFTFSTERRVNESSLCSKILLLIIFM